MLRLILFFVFLCASLFADFNLKPIKTQLLKVDDLYGYIKDSPEIRLYSSGVVNHSFEHSKSIIARVSVVAKEDGLAKLEFKVFDSLEQEALPLPNTLPQVGDEVFLNFLYDRAVAIAADKQGYDFIIKNFPSMYFTHIDIFGAQLIRTSTLAPKRSDFRKFCSDNAVGILAFALKDKIKLVDCQDFNTIYEENYSSKPQALQTPFYSRIAGYQAGFFDFNAEEMGNFYRYYEALIDLSRAR